MSDQNAKRKIVVIGGTGLIGSKVVSNLRERGFDVVSASPDSGVNTITGEGVTEVLQGAEAVVDVSNSPSFEEEAATNFFRTSTSNLLTAEEKSGVKHHVALSVVGTEILAEKEGIGGYFRAKLAQENLIKESSIPYTIVHSTQFFEFIKMIADGSTEGDSVHLPPVQVQPIAAEDVARAVADAAAGTPANGTVNIAGPDLLRLDEFIRTGLSARKDARAVVTDENAGYFGARISETTLVPQSDAQLGSTSLTAWLSVPQNVNPPQPAKTTDTGAAAGATR